jgi:hypothetical protein
MPIGGAISRWYRSLLAQPPANRCQASGLEIPSALNAETPGPGSQSPDRRQASRSPRSIHFRAIKPRPWLHALRIASPSYSKPNNTNADIRLRTKRAACAAHLGSLLPIPKAMIPTRRHMIRQGILSCLPIGSSGSRASNAGNPIIQTGATNPARGKPAQEKSIIEQPSAMPS